MVVSKTLREYIQETVERKLREKNQAERELEKAKFEKVRPELDKLTVEHVEKARKILTDAGMDPDQYGYSEANSYALNSLRPLRYVGISNKCVNDYVKDIILRIELDEIPKNCVRAYIRDYKIDDRYIH